MLRTKSWCAPATGFSHSRCTKTSLHHSLQWWRFYRLSNLQSAFRMGSSLVSTQLLYSTPWCNKLRATWKCGAWPAHFPDNDLLSSGRTSYSFTIVHAASSWDARGSPAGPSEREEERGMLVLIALPLVSWVQSGQGWKSQELRSFSAALLGFDKPGRL